MAWYSIHMLILARYPYQCIQLSWKIYTTTLSCNNKNPHYSFYRLIPHHPQSSLSISHILVSTHLFLPLWLFYLALDSFLVLFICIFLIAFHLHGSWWHINPAPFSEMPWKVKANDRPYHHLPEFDKKVFLCMKKSRYSVSVAPPPPPPTCFSMGWSSSCRQWYQHNLILST